MTRKRTECKVRSDKGIPKLWTRESARLALEAFFREHGTVSRREYERLKNGDSRYPSVKVIIALFGGLRSSLALVGDTNRTQLLWTQEEDDFLKERVGTMTVRTIARRLRRSYLATRHRMFHLKISHEDNDGRLTAKDLAAELGIHPDTVVRRVRKGEYKGQLVSGIWRITDPRESVDPFDGDE